MEDRIVWVDLEMTGLDPEVNRIIEIATVVTDANLDIIAEGPDLVVHQPIACLDAMDEWNRTHHQASGLTDAVKASTITIEQAEHQTLAFVAEHCKARTAPLAGNSIQTDRVFLTKYMPRLVAHLHYRNIDVSSVKELARRWFPYELARAPAKSDAHRAITDIRESIAELAYYRRSIFK